MTVMERGLIMNMKCGRHIELWDLGEIFFFPEEKREKKAIIP